MYTLVSYLANPERELQFLRSVAEVVIMILLPSDYSRCVPVRQLLREILACQGKAAVCPSDSCSERYWPVKVRLLCARQTSAKRDTGLSG